jgi:beta-mannanase
MALNGPACNDKTSLNNEMRDREDKKMNENGTNIKKSKTLKTKYKEMKNKTTPQCQSMIMSSLFVRMEKIMEKNSGRFHEHFSKAPYLLSSIVS